MSAMPFNNLFVMGGVLLVIMLLFVGLLVLPGKGRGWRIVLLCLLLMAGAGTLLLRPGVQRAAQRTQALEVTQTRALVSDEVSSGESCTGRGTHVTVSRTFQPLREHRRQIGGVGSVLGILGVLFAATVVLKVATRHNARTHRS